MTRGEEKVNPYKSPDPASSDDLAERLAEIKRGLSKSWFFLPNFLARLFVASGYVLLAYLIMLVIVAPIAAIIDWLLSTIA